MQRFRDRAKTAACSAAFAILVAACTTPDRENDDGSRSANGSKNVPPKSGEATIARGSVDAAYAFGSKVFGLPGGQLRLVGRVHSPLAGALSPAVVLEPGGDALAYNSWGRGRPMLRVHNFETAEDAIVEEGAFSVASSNEALAYFVGSKARVRDVTTHRGDVVVASESGERRVSWNREPAPYVVIAWAAEDLLVYRRRGMTTDVLAFSGARQMRVLARDAYLVAVDPAGKSVFLSETAPGGVRVRIVDIASGTTTASLDVTQRDPISGRPLQYVSYSGSWQHDLVAAAVSNGLAVFRVTDDTITLDQLIGLDPDTFPTGVTEPLLTSSGDSIVASGEYIANPNAALNRMALVECDRVDLRCEVGPSGPYAQPPRLVYNPSRPVP